MPSGSDIYQREERSWSAAANLEVHVVGFAFWAAVSNHHSDCARIRILVAPPLQTHHDITEISVIY